MGTQTSLLVVQSARCIPISLPAFPFHSQRPARCTPTSLLVAQSALYTLISPQAFLFHSQRPVRCTPIFLPQLPLGLFRSQHPLWAVFLQRTFSRRPARCGETLII